LRSRVVWHLVLSTYAKFALRHCSIDLVSWDLVSYDIFRRWCNGNLKRVWSVRSIRVVVVGHVKRLKLVVSTSAYFFWSLKPDLELGVYQGIPIGICSLGFTASNIHGNSYRDVSFIANCEPVSEEFDVFSCPLGPDLTGVAIIFDPRGDPVTSGFSLLSKDFTHGFPLSPDVAILD
jgi:hypothetical protein